MTYTPALHPADHPVASPWLKWPGEPIDAFQAFRQWLDSGVGRPVPSIWAANKNEDVNKLAFWARTYRWTERAGAFDVAAERDALASAVGPDGTIERENAIMARAMRLAENETRKYLEISEKSKDPIMDVRDLVRLVTEIIKLQRLRRGESTANLAVRGQPPVLDLRRLQLEDLEALEAIAERATPESEL